MFEVYNVETKQMSQHSPFLTRSEIEEITERIRYKVQCKMLKEKSIPFDITPSGRPLVLRSEYERRHGKSVRCSREPDFDAIMRRYGSQTR